MLRTSSGTRHAATTGSGSAVPGSLRLP